MKNIQEAEKLGKEHAQSLRRNLNPYKFKDITTHDIPYNGLRLLKAKCGEVTWDVKRAYCKAFNQELKI